MRLSALSRLAPSAMRINGERAEGDIARAWKDVLDDAVELVAFSVAPRPYTHRAWLISHEGRDIIVLLRLGDSKEADPCPYLDDHGMNCAWAPGDQLPPEGTVPCPGCPAPAYDDDDPEEER